MIYEIPGYQEYDGLVTEQGAYTIKGRYRLYDGTSHWIPCNRDYIRTTVGDRQRQGLSFVKQRVLHERPSRELLAGEAVYSIFGQPLLFHDGSGELNSARLIRCSETWKQDLIQEIKDVANVEAGLYGSHAVGLNSPESDLDVVMWGPQEYREDILQNTIEVLRKWDYYDFRESDQFASDACRYSQRFGLSESWGTWLANRRHRFLHDERPHLSIQFAHKNYDHSGIRTLWETNNLGQWSEEPFSGQVEVCNGSFAYNDPRTWEAVVRGQHLPCVSFHWSHQGMGAVSGYYTAKGSFISTDNGPVLLLRSLEDYLLPKNYED